MSTFKLVLVAAWHLSTLPTTRAFTVDKENDMDGNGVVDGIMETSPGYDAEPSPVIGPGRVDSSTDGRNGNGMGKPSNGRREGPISEKISFPAESDPSTGDSPPDPPIQEPPTPPAPGEEPPPPPPPPPPPASPEEPTPPRVPDTVLPAPTRSIPPDSVPRPSLISPPQSSSAAPIITSASSPPLPTNPSIQSLPPAQPTDAGSTPPTFPAPAAPSSTFLTDQHGAMSGNNSDGFEGDHRLVIALSTVLSVLGVVLIFGTICVCFRYRHGRFPLSRRGPFSNRGITPIDDEEIESWKIKRPTEKTTIVVVDRHDSAPSIRKPPSVIVYQNHNQHQPRASTEASPRSLYHKRSMDKKSMEDSQPPVLARAPNARIGLTDDIVEGDVAFLPSPKRQNSRLSKLPPVSPRHGRNRSSRSSASVGSIREYWFGYHTDLELSPRTSTDPFSHMPSSAHSVDGKRQQVYSASSKPPRLSLDEDFRLGGLSPRPVLRQSEIGIAVG